MQKLAAMKWSKVFSLFFVITLALFFGGCTNSSEAPPVWNITGSWWMFNTTSGTTGEQGPLLFSFTQATNNVSGTTNQGLAITNGDTSDLNISFSWIGEDGFTYSYSGTVNATDGSTMSGTWVNNNSKSGTWTAVIDNTPAVSLTGSWNLTITGTPVPLGSQLFTFTETGNAVSGTTTVDSSTGQSLPIVGAAGLSDVVFYWTGSDEDTYTFIGTITASNGVAASISGTWSNTIGQSGTWSATPS
jgi:hypothetical protein